MACEAAKPGHEDEVAKLKEAAKPPAAAVSFGAGGGMKFSFGAPAGAAANPTGSGFSFGAASTTASAAPTTGGFTFGTPKAADAAAETTKTPFGTQVCIAIGLNGDNSIVLVIIHFGDLLVCVLFGGEIERKRV